MKSYTINAFTDIGNIKQEEAEGYFRPIVLGIKPIDLVPIRIFGCIVLDILQLFIPRLRL